MAKGTKSSPKKEPIEQAVEEVTSEVADAIVSEQKPEAVESTDSADKSEEVEKLEEDVPVQPEKKTEAKKKTKKTETKLPNKKWWQSILIVSGLVLTVLIFVAGGFSQLYKGKVLPGVSIAGISSSSKSKEQIKTQLESQTKDLKLTLKSGKIELNPKLEEIGYQVNVDRTAEYAVAAKRDGLFDRFFFWQKTNVPAELTVNTNLLSQYVESKLPNLTKSGQDARLEYSADQGSFIVTVHKDGTGPDAMVLKTQLEATADNLSSQTIEISTTKKPAQITESKLESLVSEANEIISRSIVLTSTAGTYQAYQSDIAEWITPTPQKDGSIKLVIDKAKVKSYVQSVGQQISSVPQDRKVVKDKKTGKTVVLQEGSDGTQLADEAGLTEKIVQALLDQQNVTLNMSITTAKAETVNLEGYDKWIEIDLSEQRVTAYESATPVASYIVATGLDGFDTPVGEYAIWLRVRKQTMQGGSKADSSYYNIPNVEWVSYFYQDYALHGAWWRKKFGAPASHGCVNMTNADAQWIYNWAPLGTKVIVHY
jgi:lipoprotein-anchoring transpeptidase ErfK/SrfK